MNCIGLDHSCCYLCLSIWDHTIYTWIVQPNPPSQLSLSPAITDFSTVAGGFLAAIPPTSVQQLAFFLFHHCLASVHLDFCIENQQHTTKNIKIKKKDKYGKRASWMYNGQKQSARKYYFVIVRAKRNWRSTRSPCVICLLVNNYWKGAFMVRFLGWCLGNRLEKKCFRILIMNLGSIMTTVLQWINKCFEWTFQPEPIPVLFQFLDMCSIVCVGC